MKISIVPVDISMVGLGKSIPFENHYTAIVPNGLHMHSLCG